MPLPLGDVGLIPLLGFRLIPCAGPVGLVLPALPLEGLSHSRAAAFSNQGPFDLSLGSKAQPKGFKGRVCSTVWLVSCPSAVVLRRCCAGLSCKCVSVSLPVNKCSSAPSLSRGKLYNSQQFSARSPPRAGCGKSLWHCCYSTRSLKVSPCFVFILLFPRCLHLERMRGFGSLGSPFEAAGLCSACDISAVPAQGPGAPPLALVLWGTGVPRCLVWCEAFPSYNGVGGQGLSILACASPCQLLWIRTAAEAGTAMSLSSCLSADCVSLTSSSLSA